MSGVFTTTSSSKTGTVATYICVNTLKLGEAVIVANLVTNAVLNFSTPRVTTAVSGSQFSVGGFASGTVGSASETGLATDPFDGLGEGDQGGDWMDANGQYTGQSKQLDGKIDLLNFQQPPGPRVVV